MNEAAIGIAMGDDTEKLLKELLNGVDVDSVNIDRELEKDQQQGAQKLLEPALGV